MSEVKKLDYSSLRSTPTTVQEYILLAVMRFKKTWGTKQWKAQLRRCWERAQYPSWVTESDKNYLQYARNAAGYGPTWLDKLRAEDIPEPKFAVGDRLTVLYRPEAYPGAWTVTSCSWEGPEARVRCGVTGKQLTSWKYVLTQGEERIVISEPCDHLVQRVE